MACIACAISGLERHEKHLALLDESQSILSQRIATMTCLSMYSDRLRDFGVNKYVQSERGNVSHESNYRSFWQDDIVIMRTGEDAAEHFAQFVELMVREFDRREV